MGLRSRLHGCIANSFVVDSRRQVRVLGNGWTSLHRRCLKASLVQKSALTLTHGLRIILRIVLLEAPKDEETRFDGARAVSVCTEARRGIY
jgi:hypothetical protein